MAGVGEMILIRWRIFDHREADERVGNNVGFAGKINNFWPILFKQSTTSG